MKLSEIKDVVIKLDENHSLEFIVAQITDKGGLKKNVVRTDTSEDADVANHSYIHFNLEREFWGKFEVHLLGGGRIRIYPEQKIIEVFDQSIDHGKEPNRAQTVQLIQNAYPDYTVEQY